VVGDILQPTHLIFVLIVALLVLGPKRLPEVGRSLGRGLRDFRSALSGEEQPNETITPPAAPQTEAATVPIAPEPAAETQTQRAEPETEAEPAEPVTSGPTPKPDP